VTHLCSICGEDDCPGHGEGRLLVVQAAGTALTVILATVAILMAPQTRATVSASPTSTPTRASAATSSPPATSTPEPTPTATPSPAPSSTPTVLVNGAVAMELGNPGLSVLRQLIEAEASGMGRDGKYLVACNVLGDLWDVGGNWERLTGRWGPLGNILEGNPPRTPRSETVAVANGAVDGLACLEYPRCRFVAPAREIEKFRARGWLESGQYQYWLSPHGQALVCVPGVPDLPAPPGK